MNVKLNREGKALFDAICALPVDQIMAIKQALDSISVELDFRTWMAQVDEYMGVIVPLTHKDLEDHPYRDWYDDEVSPYDAASMALEDSGYVVEEL